MQKYQTTIPEAHTGVHYVVRVQKEASATGKVDAKLKWLKGYLLLPDILIGKPHHARLNKFIQKNNVLIMF